MFKKQGKPRTKGSGDSGCRCHPLPSGFIRKARPQGTLITGMQTVAGPLEQHPHAMGNGMSLGNTLHCWLWVLSGGVYCDACDTY